MPNRGWSFFPDIDGQNGGVDCSREALYACIEMAVQSISSALHIERECDRGVCSANPSTVKAAQQMRIYGALMDSANDNRQRCADIIADVEGHIGGAVSAAEVCRGELCPAIRKLRCSSSAIGEYQRLSRVAQQRAAAADRRRATLMGAAFAAVGVGASIAMAILDIT